jgi:hypothetical protein
MEKSGSRIILSVTQTEGAYHWIQGIGHDLLTLFLLKHLLFKKTRKVILGLRDLIKKMGGNEVFLENLKSKDLSLEIDVVVSGLDILIEEMSKESS